MKMRMINAPDAPAAVGGYAQAIEINAGTRRLYISGQVPVTRDGVVPATFIEQARLAWANIHAQLSAADMTIANLAKVTIFLSDREFASDNRMARNEALGGHVTALTVIIADIFDPAWLLEIEAIAEA